MKADEDDWAAFEEAKPVSQPATVQEDPFDEVLKPKLEVKKEIKIDFGMNFGKKEITP